MSVFSRKHRASDLDRAMTCTALDNAYAEGQLDTTEHGNRIAAAMKAKTLGELDGLTADLQRGDPSLYPRPAETYAGATYPGAPYQPPTYHGAPYKSAQPVPFRPPGRRSGGGGNALVMLAVVGLVVLVLAGLGGMLLFRVADGDSAGGSGSSGGLFGNPIIAETPDNMTADGFRALIASAQDRFGDTLFDEVVIYPEYAIFTRQVPGEPGRATRYTWRGGFDEGSPTPRSSTDAPVDLAQVNVDAALGLMAGAGQSLNVRDVTSRYFIVGGVFGPLRVYVSNEYSESGYIAAGLDGTVRSVYPNE